MEHLLWQSTTKPLRYFLVPAETEVFTGGFEIENSDDGKYSVDLDGIVEYEITKKHADQIMEKELEGLLSDFGSVLKGLAKVGKQIVNSSNDSEDDSSSDEEDSSEYDSSDEELEADELNDILKSFLSELEEPLNELREIIDSEFDTLEEEFANLGQKLNDEIGSDDGKALLRELGERLIQLADDGWDKGSDDERSDTEDDSDDEMVTIQFTNNESSVEDDAPAEAKSEDVLPEVEEQAEEAVQTPDENNPEPQAELVEEQAEEAAQASEIPSRTALNKMKKGELLALASSLSLDLSDKNTKKELVEGIENCR